MTVNLVDLPPMNPKPLNGAQFSQGTLWDPRAMKPSPEHRWAAHGYSPERREEVRQAIPTKNISTTSKFYQGDIYPAQREVGGKLANQKTATRNSIVDVVARSTVPIEDLARNTPKFKVGVWNYAGQMQSKYDTVAQRPVQGEIRLNPYHLSREAAEHTLLHELGHHADYESDPESFRRTAKTEMVRGQPSPSLEGAAEGYAAKHHVTRRNEKPADYSRTAASGYRYLHSRSGFQEHFQRVSGRELGEAMGTNKPAHMSEQFVQGKLFEGDADTGYIHGGGGVNDLLDTLRVGDSPTISDDEWKHLTGGRK